MDKDRSKLNPLPLPLPNPKPTPKANGVKCTKPETCTHLLTRRQQQLEKISSTRVLHVVHNFQENRSDEDIFFDCMSIGDSDMIRDANSCKSSNKSSDKSNNIKGSCQTPTKCDSSRFDDSGAFRAALERVAQGAQMC